MAFESCAYISNNLGSPVCSMMDVCQCMGQSDHLQPYRDGSPAHALRDEIGLNMFLYCHIFYNYFHNFYICSKILLYSCMTPEMLSESS
jgi:hypothetical protein